MSVPAVPAPPEPINGNELLDEIRAWLARFIITTTEGDIDLLTLWTAHTHLVIETHTTPRLQIDSPVPESGKTTCLEHLQRLSLRPVTMATIGSPALLTRMLNVEQRTILIDEADRSLNPEKEGIADLLAVLNSGYKNGATRPVLVPGQGGQWAVAEMPTYAAVCIAGNQPSLPDDTRSRIIRVLLLPDSDGTAEESDWELIEDEALGLRGQLEAWADEVREQVRTKRPELPEGITGRFREKWAPLKRVAIAAGGQWPAAVDGMAKQDKAEHEMDVEDGAVTTRAHITLLTHIWELWPDGTKFLATTELIDMLVISHPSMWGDENQFGKQLTPQRLGRMLAKSFKIHSGREDPHRGNRGYFRSSFAKAWRQLRVDPSHVTAAASAAPATAASTSAEDAPPAEDAAVTGGGVLA